LYFVSIIKSAIKYIFLIILIALLILNPQKAPVQHFGLRASIPTAPLPANRSRKFDPAMPGPSTLKGFPLSYQLLAGNDSLLVLLNVFLGSA
jgi:hypothetical protein